MGQHAQHFRLLIKEEWMALVPLQIVTALEEDFGVISFEMMSSDGPKAFV